MTFQFAKVSLVIGLSLAASACGGGPGAMDVCRKLEAAGAAKECKEGKREGVNSAAKDVAKFDVPGFPGKGGVVLSFSNDSTYDATMRSYVELGSLNAQHRFGSRKKLVFVSINEDVKEEMAGKAKGVVEAL